MNRGVLTREVVHRTVKLGEDVTITCDVEGLGREYSYLNQYIYI